MPEIVMEIMRGTATLGGIKCPNCGNKCFGVITRTLEFGTSYLLRCSCGVSGPRGTDRREAVEKFKSTFGPR